MDQISVSVSRKVTSIFLIIIIVLNLVLFAVGMINQLWFWIITLIIGLIAYKVVPKLSK